VHGSGLPAFWFWPNVDAGSDGTSKGLRVFRERHPDAPIHFFRNMQSEDFLRLLYNCRCLVGNSSAGIREGSFLGVPVVNIGTRQGGRQRGPNVADVGYDTAAIQQAIGLQVAHGRYPAEAIYGDGQAGQRIAGLLATCALPIEKRLTYAGTNG
jgi:UDP-N-acetylglucosamine 2-epimerase